MNKAKKTLVTLVLVLILFVYTDSVMAIPDTLRLAGENRYTTAIEVSKQGWPSGADNIVLTTGENYPDALCAAPLAGKYNAPILLVGRNGLDSKTIAEINRLNPQKAFIVGGKGVIPGSVENQLNGMNIKVQRFAGGDRYETALLVARDVGMSKGLFIVSGEDYIDALSVAPIAAVTGMALLPVPSSDLTKNQKSQLSRVKLDQVIIVGDLKKISKNIRSQFPNTQIIDDDSPYHRNISVINYFKNDLNCDSVFVATGQSYPDALSAAAYAKKNKNPIILLDGNKFSSATEKFFSENFVSKIFVLGGESVISSSSISHIKALLPQILKIEDIYVTVAENSNFELPSKVVANTNSGSKIEVPVKWNLTNVSTSKTGTYYFQGHVDGVGEPVQLILTVEAAPILVDVVNAEIIRGKSYTLPTKVKVTMSDYTTKEMDVTWSSTPTVSMLNKEGSYNFQGTINGTELKTSLNLKVSNDKAIAFNDSSLEWAIKYILGKPSSTQPVYLSEILELETLNLKGYGIKDLKGIDSFTNLKELDLSNNLLESNDLNYIAKLTNLEKLNLRNNSIQQITSLNSLKKLTHLNLSFNKINDFGPLRDYTRLTSLYLEGNQTKDYSPTSLYYNLLKDKDFNM